MGIWFNEIVFSFIIWIYVVMVIIGWWWIDVGLVLSLRFIFVSFIVGFLYCLFSVIFVN